MNNLKQNIDTKAKIKSFTTNDGIEITYYEWSVEKPLATIQVVHGSIEHALRYEEFALAMNKAGFSVFAMDLRGHGQTGARGQLGHIADENGAELVMQDVNQLNSIIKKKEFGSKLVLLGHSMGSFIVRAYVTKYYDVDILISIGSNHPKKALINLMRFVSKVKAIKHGNEDGTFLHNLSYKAYDKKFKKEGQLAWLSFNRENRNEYVKDPFTRFKMTNQAFFDFSTWMKIFTDKHEVAKMQKSLRILLLNGTDDPVGNMGKDIIKANKFYTNLGFFSEQIEYEDMRHEILKDDLKEMVFRDIIKFILLRVDVTHYSERN